MFHVNKYSLTNIAAYSHHHRIPFFFRNAHLVNTFDKAAYWGKMPVVKTYLLAGFEWVIWTDTDVLFMKKDSSIIQKWIQPAHDAGRHLAFVGECDPQGRNYTGALRSGFFAVRNSFLGHQFLQEWEESYDRFNSEWNPEQEALENLVSEKKYKDQIYVVNPFGIHTYPDCFDLFDQDAISLHFVADYKEIYFEYLTKSDFWQGDVTYDFEINPVQAKK
jgi:hypothetical protein